MEYNNAFDIDYEDEDQIRHRLLPSKNVIPIKRTNFNVEIYSSISAMLKDYIKLENKDEYTLLSKDISVSLGGAKEFLFMKTDEISDFIQAVPLLDRNYYEIEMNSHGVQQNRKLKIDFDVPEYLDKGKTIINPDFQDAKYLEQEIAFGLKELIEDTFNRANREINPDSKDLLGPNDVIIFDSCSENKVSFHVVVNKHYVSDQFQARNFMLKCKNTDWRWAKFIDQSVYSSVQNFRLVLNRKIGKYNIKKPCTFSDGTRPSFTDCLVTYTKNCKVFSCLGQEKEKKTYKLNEASDEQIERVMEMFHSLDTYKDEWRLRDFKDGIIILKQIGPSFCKLCERTHDGGSDNNSLFLTLDNDGNVYLHCRRYKDSGYKGSKRLFNIETGEFGPKKQKRLLPVRSPTETVDTKSEILPGDAVVNPSGKDLCPIQIQTVEPTLEFHETKQDMMSQEEFYMLPKNHMTLANFYHRFHKSIMSVPDIDKNKIFIFDFTNNLWKEYHKRELKDIVSHYFKGKFNSIKLEANDPREKTISEMIANVQTASFLRDVMDLLWPKFYDKEWGKKIHSQKFVFPFNNGTLYDFKLEALRDITKEDYITNGCDIPFVKDDKQIEFANGFFDTVYDSNKELIEYLQRYLGWCLMKDKKGYEFLVLLGSEGSNSKDTILDLMKRILQSDFKTGNDSILMKREIGQANSHTSHLVPLEGKKLVSFSEPEGTHFNVNGLKKLTGCSTLPTRKAGNPDEIDIELTPKYIIVLNSIPLLEKKDIAFEKRLIMVESPITFNPDFRGQDNFREPDENIAEKIANNLSGFLWVLIQGGKRYMKDKMRNPPACVKASKEEYVENYDKVKAFCNNYIKVSEEDIKLEPKKNRIKSSDLIKLFNRTYRQNFGDKQFGSEMKLKGFISHKIGSYNWYYIKAKEPEKDDDNDDVNIPTNTRTD